MASFHPSEFERGVSQKEVLGKDQKKSVKLMVATRPRPDQPILMRLSELQLKIMYLHSAPGVHLSI